MQYNEQTFQWITNEKAAIEQVAQILGVSVTAIAGAMAKERYEYDDDPGHAAVNPIQDFLGKTFPDPNVLLQRSYQNMIDKGLVGTIPDGIDKLLYPTMNDYGYANIKLQTAIEVIKEASTGIITALGLDQYVSNYSLLESDLAANANGVAAKITGLVVQKADKFFTDHGALGWDTKSESERDALRVTYFANGEQLLEQRYTEQTASGGNYDPQSGGGSSGGDWTKDNSPRLTQIFGLDYARYTQGTTNSGSFSVDYPALNISLGFDLDHQISILYNQGQLGQQTYQGFTQNLSNWLVSDQTLPYVPGFAPNYDFGLSFDAIGAFYESQTPTTDNAPSIALKTPVVLDAANRGLTQTTLGNLDSNHDGKLNGTELGNLRAWADANENGVADANEITVLNSLGISEIRSTDYGFYTRGNSRLTDVIATSPEKASDISLSALALPAILALPVLPPISFS